jgi:chromosome partitioning protein
MPVIALIGNKGGAGKTTLALNLAAALAREGSVAVFDADPQGSALQWRAVSEHDGAPPVIDAAADLEDIVARMSGSLDYVFIDCPPSVHSRQTNAALHVSDILLIPVQPSPLDLWATVHSERAIGQARASNPTLRAMLVINQLDPRTRVSRLMRDALAEVDLPAADTAIHRRAVYGASVLEGKSVFDMGKRGAEAASELQELISEVFTP